MTESDFGKPSHRLRKEDEIEKERSLLFYTFCIYTTLKFSIS